MPTLRGPPPARGPHDAGTALAHGDRGPVAYGDGPARRPAASAGPPLRIPRGRCPRAKRHVVVRLFGREKLCSCDSALDAKSQRADAWVRTFSLAQQEAHCVLWLGGGALALCACWHSCSSKIVRGLVSATTPYTSGRTARTQLNKQQAAERAIGRAWQQLSPPEWAATPRAIIKMAAAVSRDMVGVLSARCVKLWP